jgi:hypothetical protein
LNTKEEYMRTFPPPVAGGQSARQPHAGKRLFALDEFDIQTGKALCAKIGVWDVAQYYAKDPTLPGGYNPEWGQTEASAYMRMPRNSNDALNNMENFVFPASVRSEAMRTADLLSGVFEDVAHMSMERDCVSGRLDRRKLGKLAQSADAGSYDVNTVRPYRRNTMQRSTPPTIAIVASAPMSRIWADAQYLPRIATLTLGVQWACQAAGLSCYSALTDAHEDPNKYGHILRAVMLTDDNREVSLNSYGALMQSDMFRCGRMVAQMADPAAYKALTAKSWGTVGYAWAIFWSSQGGCAVQWARESLNADVVIAIGSISDSFMADVKLEGRFDIRTAAQSIAKQAARLR